MGCNYLELYSSDKIMSYRIIENKIFSPKACEINVVDHCNLSCRGCSHLAPTFVKRFEDPNKVFEQCSILAKYYRPKYIKVNGGEPLLHPNLVEVIDAIRSSGISDYIQVATNGQLLAEMPDLFWQKVDSLYVSIYPDKKVNSENLKIFKQKARAYNVSFQHFYFDNFRDSYSEVGTKDTNLVERIYSTCKIAHTWKCHTVSEGYFYKCPRSLFLPKVINNDFLKPYNDGIKITDSPEFAKDLLTYLESTKPLSSCYYCLGNVGKLFAHEQKPHAKWRQQQAAATEELIDMDYLARSEKNPHANTLCVRYRSPIKKMIIKAQHIRANVARLTR